MLRLRWCVLTCSILLLGGMLSGCPDAVTGPQPEIDPPAAGQDLPVQPGLVCRDQLTTEVKVRGKGFSPLPVGIPEDPEAALPALTLRRRSDLAGGEAEAFSLTYSGRPDGPNAEKLSWQSPSEMTFVVDQALEGPEDGRLAPGLFDVEVKNPNTAQGQTPGALAVLPRPAFDGDPSPGILCLAEGARALVLTGSTFLREGETAPVLQTGDSRFEDPQLDGCTKIPHEGIDAALCTSATFTLAQDALAPGLHDLVLANPGSAGCQTEETLQVRIVAPPTLDRVEPALLCVDEGDRPVTVYGEGFLEIDGALPAVTVGGEAVPVTAAGGCTELQTQGHTVRSCTELSVTVPQAMVTAVSEPELTVTNPDPAGCSGSASAVIALVPPPVITDVQPPAACNTDGPQTLVLTGTGFLTVDGTVPTVTLDGTPLDPSAVVPSDCTASTLAGIPVEQCTTLSITFVGSDQTPPEVGVAVENPAPAGCTSTWSEPIPLVDPPTVDAVEPALVCTDDGDRSLIVRGTGFLRIGGADPEVQIGGVPVSVDAVAGCAPDTIGSLSVERCTEITVTAAAGSLSPGEPEVVVTNPPPVACAGASTTVLDVPPTLTLTGAVPGGFCSVGGDQTLEIRGTGLLRIDGNTPSVLLAGNPYPVTAMVDCTPLDVAGLTVESCDGIQVFVASGSLTQSDVPVTVTNPDPSGCGESATGILSVFTPPTLTQVSPAAVCENVDYTLTLTGTDIAPGATVALVDPQSGTTYDADSVTVTGSTRADATWLAGSVPPGSYDLTLDNGGGCEDTVAGVVDVKPEPFVFFVDPPVLYNGASFQVTVYISGLDAPTSAVELIDAQGTVTPLVASSAPGQFNRIFAEVPAGLPAGAYDVRVTSDVGCVGTLPAGLTLTDTLTVAVDSIDPAYVSPTRRTAVTIRATDPVPMGQVGFVDTPRAYLSPNPPQPGVFATALRAVVFQDDKTLSAVVPANMSPGVYDLVVVNPDGTVGLLTGGLTVTSAEPPRITAVQPASLDNNTPQTATVLGEHFDTSGVTVDMHCREPDGTESTVAATVLAATLTDSSVDAIFPTDLYPTGTVCLVILTNSDGASFTYSAISLKNPAQNLFPWTAAPPMTTPRQGHALVAARPTDTSRFVYAIGGDDGSSVHASVEASQVGVFGNMGAFRQERHALPEPRTFLGAARIGRFIYAVGGSDGTAAADSTYRAQILDPLDTPEIVDLSLSLDSDVSGLGAGRWFYRVSALFPASDPANPGGESLPGETLVVQIPAVSGVELTLQWDPIPGAAGYRIYRTPGPDLGADAVELLAEVSGGGAVTYTDDGTVATDPAVTPLPPGSLGVWHAVDLLPAAREAHAVVAAPDPATPNLWHLYALGGRDAGGYLDSYAYLSVTIHPPAQPKASETHTLSGWSTGTGTLQNSRAYVGAWLVDEVDLPPVGAGNHWIYVGPGEGPLGATGAVDAAQVPAGGDIPAFTAVNRSVSNDRRGAGYGDGSGFLYLFGGGTGGSDSGVSAEMCTSTGSGCSSVPPDLEPDAWNSLGISMSEPRVYCAAAQESAFFFVSGGYNGVAVTASVDRTVQ